MKKKSIYTASLLVFFVAALGIVFKYKNDEKNGGLVVYLFLSRQGQAAQTEEWKMVSTRGGQLVANVKAYPDDSKTLLALASLYVQEARITGNYMYYDRAALACVDHVLKSEPQHFNALSLKALLCLSQHHFAEGLQVATAAQKINPYNAFIYGLIVDGNVEMGHYTTAVENADKMVSIRPDIRSYSRISYLREIHGDYPGSIEAMKMAISAGVPGDEATEWCRVQLGRLYENTGDMKSAEMHYTIALENRPGYAKALAGLARAAAAGKDYPMAIAYYQQADSLINDYSIKEELADVYTAAGMPQKAQQTAESVINGMNDAAARQKKSDSSGHYSDRELAYAYLRVKDYDQALGHALLEYNRRPDNIDVNETLAWTYYCKGDYAKAASYIKTALKTNSRNPVLLRRADLINAKALLQ